VAFPLFLFVIIYGCGVVRYLRTQAFPPLALHCYDFFFFFGFSEPPASAFQPVSESPPGVGRLTASTSGYSPFVSVLFFFRFFCSLIFFDICRCLQSCAAEWRNRSSPPFSLSYVHSFLFKPLFPLLPPLPWRPPPPSFQPRFFRPSKNFG